MFAAELICGAVGAEIGVGVVVVVAVLEAFAMAAFSASEFETASPIPTPAPARPRPAERAAPPELPRNAIRGARKAMLYPFRRQARCDANSRPIDYDSTKFLGDHLQHFFRFVRWIEPDHVAVAFALTQVREKSAEQN